MDFNTLKFLKYTGTPNLFMALVKNKEEYYIFISKTMPPKIKIGRDILGVSDILDAKPITIYFGSINIDCLVNNDETLFNLFKLNNEKEFDIISKILGYYYG